MKYFPVFLDLEGRNVVVAGGGEAAMQKLRLLLKTSAQISVYSEKFCEEFDALIASGRITAHRRAPKSTDVSGAALVYAASGHLHTDRSVAALARAAKVPVNAVDRPDISDFLTPAIVDRDPVTVAIGTEGAAPVLARHIKAQIEALLPASTGAIARLAAAWRHRLAALVPEGRARRRVWQRFFANGIPASDDGSSLGVAQIRLKALATAEAMTEEEAGLVSLIETEFDDPEALTAIARRRLHEADVIVFDRDAAPCIRELARREAKFIPIDTLRAAMGPSRQRDMIAREARAGQRIVWLFTDGRPGTAEIEMIALGIAGIDYELVAKIPLSQAKEKFSATAALPAQMQLATAQMRFAKGGL